MIANRKTFAAAALLALSECAIAFSSDSIPFLQDLESGHDPKDHWAVVVAGSRDYWNYRH